MMRYIEDPIGDHGTMGRRFMACMSVTIFTIPVIIYGISVISNRGNSTACWVIDSKDECFSQAIGSGVDMAARFKTLSWIGLGLSSFTWFNLIWTQYIKFQGWQWGMYISLMIDIPITIVWFCYLSYQRFSHAGKVVSGAICPKDVSCTARNGYLTTTGSIFKWWLILFYSLILLDLLGKIRNWLKKRGEEESPGFSPPGLSQDYLDKYEHVGDQPIGAGACGVVWKVKKRDSDDD